MSRSRLLDKLQSHRFWAFDASTDQETPVFSPLFGFSSISSPTLAVEVEEIKDGTYQFPRQLVKGATTGSVLFERAASPFDSDFYDWITHTIYGSNVAKSGGSLSHAVTSAFFDKSGTASWRKKIVIVQFTGINLAPEGDAGGSFAAFILGGLAGAAAGGLSATIGAGIGGAGAGPFDFSPKLPARGWVLHGCVPINYRAASDFDARSGAISLMELEVQPEYMEEWSLGIKP